MDDAGHEGPPAGPHRPYRDFLEAAALADRLRFHSVWTSEHHFVEDGGRGYRREESAGLGVEWRKRNEWFGWMLDRLQGRRPAWAVAFGFVLVWLLAETVEESITLPLGAVALGTAVPTVRVGRPCCPMTLLPGWLRIWPCWTTGAGLPVVGQAPSGARPAQRQDWHDRVGDGGVGARVDPSTPMAPHASARLVLTSLDDADSIEDIAALMVSCPGANADPAWPGAAAEAEVRGRH